ncbi:porin [Burkholderia perseverans]|uniref:porin n=1 Tax=Burkholderia perseverans TaxID=2615214 RepID=UPI002467D5FF|nr:porin [Burkholderia perseverans]
MKIAKTLVPAMLAVSAGVAHAQSSVALYGTIDEGFEYASNLGGKSDYGLVSGNRQLGDRWGLKGSEDLGGGLHAVFQLENGFNVNNGALSQSGEMFGRQAFVGLSSERFGTVTLGRQYDSVVDYVAPLSAAGSWGGSLFSHPFDADNLDETFRINNAIKYASPEYAGLQFGGLYGFSNQAGGFASNRAWSVGARYRLGSLVAAAGFLDVDGEDLNTSGAAVGTLYEAARQTVAAAGLGYAFGAATFGLVYTHTNLDGAPLNTALRHVRFDNIEFNAKYDVTSAWYLAMMYLYTSSSIQIDGLKANPSVHVTAPLNNPHYNEIGLTVGYHLSRRTEVYLQGLYQHASGNQNASIGALDDSSTGNQTVARVGIRTAF